MKERSCTSSWPSSPSSLGAAHPNDCDRGDTHFWEVWHEGRPFERYLEVGPRFCSEFGFQSFPVPATLRTAIDEALRLSPTTPPSV